MKQWILFMGTVVILGLGIPAFATDDEILKEIESLKKRIAQLEQRLQEKEASQREGIKDLKADLGELKRFFQEKLGGLSIHGGVVGYYQGMTSSDIGGVRFGNPDGAGYGADLELSFEPLKGGEFSMRLHAGEGDGADRDIEPQGGLFADLNGINDDNPGGQVVDLLEAYYTQRFLDGRFFFALGKTEPAVFLDDNAFANDPGSQFMGKPFINDPTFNSEDEYGLLLAVGFRPVDEVNLVLLGQSSSHGGAKSTWEKIFDRPFIGAQVSYSPRIRGLEGNYRFYGWAATYRHQHLASVSGTAQGWGIGLSLDQRIAEKVGVFARLGYHSREVYPVEWFWSLGFNLKGVLQARPDDELGIGIAGLLANPRLEDAFRKGINTGLLLSGNNDDMEYHLEFYYRVVISENLALSPDIQYVINPLGDSKNDSVFVGGVRGEFSF